MMEGSVRRLAAIMFTDIVGYTALVQQNETLALELLAEHRSLMRPLIAHHEGREIKTMGDGFLIEFPSALQAVRCAIEIQRALRDRATTQPSTSTLSIRIGVHLGDVEHREGDILGDGVNIASRIQHLAEPGGICVSGQVFDQVENKIDIGFASLGARTLKHIARPMEVYRMILPQEERPPPELPRSRVAARSKHSIAVLPFVNMSSDPENEYFSDGLTEDILAQLAKIQSLKVISRTSVMRYKGTDKPLRQIAEELGVLTVLEGTARKAGDRVRIVAQLVDAQADEHLWAETYDRDLTDIFAIQTELAKKIARALQAEITSTEEKRVEKQPTKSVEAYNLVLEGRFELSIWPRTEEQVERAIRGFQQAIRLDPEYAQAYSALADAYWLGLGYAEKKAEEECLAKAEQAARQALDLDDTLAEAHSSAGAISVRRFNWAEAERSYRRALELSPGSAPTHHRYALLLAWQGRLDEARTHILRARELDPNSNPVWLALCTIHFFARQYERALEAVQILLRRVPDMQSQFHSLIGLILLQLGRYDEALAEFQLHQQQAPEAGWVRSESEVLIAMAEDHLGREGVLHRTLQRWEIETDESRVEPSVMAAGHLQLGDHERALDWLERGCERRPAGSLTIKVNPMLDPLRDDPRFQKLLIRLGLTE